MKGYVPVEIPTKLYIKAYIISKLGPDPVMSTQGNSIGHKLYDLLHHKTNERAVVFASKHYTEKIKVYIPLNWLRKRGWNLTETNIKNFNLFVETELKHRFHTSMDDMISVFPNFAGNLPEVRKRIGIDVDAWADESMKKSYYRYRLSRAKTKAEKYYLKKYISRTFSQSVPHEFLPDN